MVLSKDGTEHLAIITIEDTEEGRGAGVIPPPPPPPKPSSSLVPVRMIATTFASFSSLRFYTSQEYFFFLSTRYALFLHGPLSFFPLAKFFIRFTVAGRELGGTWKYRSMKVV
jgi:hypothetical protein